MIRHEFRWFCHLNSSQNSIFLVFFEELTSLKLASSPPMPRPMVDYSLQAPAWQSASPRLIDVFFSRVTWPPPLSGPADQHSGIPCPPLGAKTVPPSLPLLWVLAPSLLRLLWTYGIMSSINLWYYAQCCLYIMHTTIFDAIINYACSGDWF